MKNTRLIKFLIVLFLSGPFLSTGMDMCSMCHEMEMEMSSCHTASTLAQASGAQASGAQASGQAQLTPACCCAELSCADQETAVQTAIPVEALTIPALELVAKTSFNGFIARVAHAPKPVAASIPRTTAVPLYQLKSSFLI